MPTIRVEKTKQYTVISNHHLKDKRLSLKSIGLLTIMLSLPDGWDFSVSGFAKICKDGITAINSAMKELEVYGYVQRNYTRDQKGRYIDIEYVVREVPLAEIPAQNPIVENPILDKPREINTNLIKYLMEDGYARANEGFSSDGADKNTEHFSPSSTVTVPPSRAGWRTRAGSILCSSSGRVSAKLWNAAHGRYFRRHQPGDSGAMPGSSYIRHSCRQESRRIEKPMAVYVAGD